MKSIIGNIVTPNGVRFGIITFSDGLIRKVEFLDVDPLTVSYPSKSVYIFPGFIDVAATCYDDITHEYSYREDYESLGMAALNGGVVQILELPKRNNIVDQSFFSKCPVDILPSHVVYGSPLKNAHYVVTNYHYQVSELGAALERYSGCNVSFYFGSKNNSDEYLNTMIILGVIKELKINAKIAVSTNLALREIIEAKKDGITVSSEVLIHNLYFDDTMIKQEYRPYLTFDYPIRSYDDRISLLKSLNAGEIDYISSYHIPCLTNEKTAGVLNGPQLDLFGGFLCYLIECKNIDPVQILRCVCENPGTLIGEITGRKIDKIEKGYEASFTILDLSSTNDRPMQTKAGWSILDSRYLPGLAIEVYIRGVRMVSGERVGSLT